MNKVEELKLKLNKKIEGVGNYSQVKILIVVLVVVFIALISNIS